MNAKHMSKSYWKMEYKRLAKIVPGAICVLAGCVFLGTMLCTMLKMFFPDSLRIKPFQVGVCIEEDPFIVEVISGYIEDLDISKSLVNFVVMEKSDLDENMENGTLQAGIWMKKQTIQSIMDGDNEPVYVYLADYGDAGGSVQQYLEQKIIRELTQQSAVYVRLPQAQDQVLYQLPGLRTKIAEENDEAQVNQILMNMEFVIDLFHSGLAADRLEQFKLYALNDIGNLSLGQYYLGTFIAIIWALWGICFSGYWSSSQKDLAKMMKKAGLSYSIQAYIRMAVFGTIYLLPCLIFSIWCRNVMTFIVMTLVSVIVMMQLSFFFIIIKNAGNALFINVFVLLLEAFGVGMIVPKFYLPKTLVDLFSQSPLGLLARVIWELLRENSLDSITVSYIWDETGYAVIAWCIVFAVAIGIVQKMHQSIEETGGTI